MAAYNWILLETTCPQCGTVGPLRCQTHIASDFGGDQSGRFCHREYVFGQRMAWWSVDDRYYHHWAEEDGEPLPDGSFAEACYADCSHCGAHLCALLRFENLIPCELLRLSLESDWPPGYLR